MKNYLKRTTTFFLALLMLLSVPLQAFAEVTQGAAPPKEEKKINYDKTPIRKGDYVNKVDKLPVVPAKPGEGQTAEEFIKNPDQPAIYTLRTDYKVQRGEEYQVDYQPYISSVGAAATQTEKDKVNKTIDLPDIAGYDKLQDNFTINYDTIVKKAKAGTESKDANNGDRYNAKQEFDYKARSNSIKIKHVFQDLEDFTKYTNPDGSVGETGELITTQNGNTGSTMEVSPLDKNDPRVKGFVPEADSITMQVPENAENFILEYRYNRAHYDVVYDTAGGTELPARTLYYGQAIPKIADESIPKKVGGDFLGWKPSVELKTKDGKTFKANEIIAVGTGGAIKDLNANLIMPASNITFTAVWKDKEKADYAVQFWAEKADHSDGASLADKYDYIGTRVYKDKDTGMRPDLDNEPVKDIVFPDLDQARLNKIWAGKRFNRGRDPYLNKFYVYNQVLTHDQNKDPANVNLVKSVDATGKTVYNIYYDRQVYDLYFTKSNAQPAENTFYPEIWGYDKAKGESVMLGGPGKPYHYKARFNELMYEWPNDAKQTKGFTPGYQSFGWGPNYTTPNWPLYLDTPPYRLNAEEFLDMANYTKWGGYVKKIDKGDGTSIDLDRFDFKTLSFGIKQDKPSIPHHMDFWMDGFKNGETIIRYDLVRTKADTDSLTYGHKYPEVLGFTPYDYNPRAAWPFIEEGQQENGRVNGDEIDTLNDEREEITPNNSGSYYNNQGIRLPIGQLDFISVFFSDSDEFGDVKEGGQEFKENGYLRFKYHRNKYQLRFNFDPSIIRDDSYFNSKNQLDTFYQFPLKVLSPDLVPDGTERKDREYFKEDPKNFIDNPENLQKLGLTDLVFTDPKDGKLKVKRPDNLSDQMVFKGWALDPAGTKLIWENPGEKMPSHPVNLYAKWGEPDYKWKVTFDPNGGSLRNIKEENLTTSRKKLQEGDIGQEEINTYAKKEESVGDKQVFTVIQRQKLVEPKKPTRKGYDFMGWEVIRYKKDNKGDYTDQIDTSYRDTYKVPELYSFGNDVVAPVYLKAIWVPNNRVDVKVEHHFLSLDLSKETKAPVKKTLADKRANYLVATTGDQQDDEYILATHEELTEKLTGDLKTLYDEYNKRVKANNTFFQQFRVEPEKKLNPETNQVEANPDVKNNVFHFFYRPFRTRDYKVNYIDERFKDDPEKGKIIDQELVTNGNRHYDARNYRRIPGWVLVGDPQQQLFFDVDEDTNAFKGINGTGKDEITFYYKDVRVIEIKDPNEAVPDGYVRVTFKADKGGSFGKDAQGKDITELNYDVIKGLKSDLLPVPKELEEGKTKEEGKYYITPETGRKFIKWDEKPLLNKNTIIENDAKDFYVFTAKFEWSGLTASGLVRTEAFKDKNGKWTNDFAPTIDQLKKQLVWREKDEVKDLPAGTEIKLYDEAGNELTTDEQVYELVNEKNKADKDELVRTVNIKAKVTFKDGKEPQELDIPITVYKNVYEALNKEGDKPLFLKEAEGKEAKDGGLKDVTGDYVKVTVQPTEKNTNKDAKVYYVNPKAWVNIPEVAWSEADKDKTDFLKWTADKKDQNENKEENGVFDFSKRHKFTENTVISPGFSKDVVPQEGQDKPKVPDNFVKVIVDKTTNAKLGTEEKQIQTFWVNPTKEVTIPVTNPTGKTDQEVDIPKLGKKKVNYVFNEWQKVKAGEADDKLTEVKPAAKIDLSKNQYTDKVTVIKAAYYERFAATPIVKPIKTEELHTPEGKEITDKDLIKKITPPANKEIESITVVEKPDPSKPGKQEAKVTIKYTDGSTQGTKDNPVVIPVEVHKNIIPEAPGGQKPKDALENYVKVIFKAGEGGTVSGDLVYYVSPEVEVDMTQSATKITKTPDTGYIVNGEKWNNKDNKTLKGTFTDSETEFVFTFNKSKDVVEKIDEKTKKPDGYVTVIFRADDHGKLEGDKVEKTYYVNPNAGIKLVELEDGEVASEKELAVPTTIPNKDYGFAYWSESLDLTNTITGDREYVAHFTKGQVTLTYDAGGATGSVPDPESTKIGGRINLSSPSGLSNGNKNFIGWMVDGRLYQVGSQLTLTKNKTAVAKWTEDIYPADENGNKTEETPENYVKVTLVPTEKAIDSANKIYYVNPDKYLTIPAEDPTVKNDYKEKGYSFSHWDKPLFGQFTKDTTITARYKISSSPITPLEPYAGIVETRVGIQPKEKDYKDKITPPKGKTIESVEIIKKPDVSKEGVSSAKVNVNYTDGSSSLVDVTVVVYGKIPEKPDYPSYPDRPDYPSYPGRPIPMYPEVRYETIIKEKIVKVPVPVTDGYFKEVRYMQGFNGYFRPNDGLTRAEAAQILANALVEDGYKYNPNFKISYKDVGEAWYTRAVKIVTEAKVFTGYDDGNFKPQAKITRNEWIATLKRFQELGSASGNNMKLRDGHWAKAEIQAAFNEGWLKIYTDGLATYKGDEFIPRQEVAAVSNKAFKRIVDKTYIGKNNLSLVTYKDVNTSMWAYEDILCASNTFLDRKDRYIAHWVKEDKNQFNIDTSDFKIVQKNFQRNPR
ncbi:S-layer homology domain-containing protein [Peptoniphilus lacrimalis]|uniref:S-layer homology domain n=1 Tax=Peptoniphilus lacrimalis TaxID=33031 RepID=A0A379C8M1_9FIRM|nr:S-layer homology domain-containing protein [Peptoniphilus lacrimalis]SUB57947.1 S-layer homology domain [Peptoniphilus lacrimalis]